MNHMTHHLSSADISIFYWKSTNIPISRNADGDCILMHNFSSFIVLKDLFNKYDCNFDDLSKNGYFFETKVMTS